MSNSYSIFETDEFLKKLSKLTSKDAGFIRKKLVEYIYPQISKEPYFGKNIRKLRSYKPDVWRYRIGRFRVFYSIDQEESIINVLTVDFRKDLYK